MGNGKLTKDESGGIWGYTKKDWENFNPKRPASENPPAHYFRNRKCIHETLEEGKIRKDRFSRLAFPRPSFDPFDQDKPQCRAYACLECLKRLETEKLDEELREKGCKAKVRNDD